MLEQIRAATATMKPLLDSIRNGLIVLDADWNRVACNAAAERLLGLALSLPAAESAGRYFYLRPDGGSHVAWDDRPLVRAMRGEAVDDEEYVVLGAANERALVSVSARALRDAAGAVVGVVGAFREVPEARREERALRASEERFRTLSQHAPVGIFETDAQGYCLFVNDRWTALTGMSPGRTLARGWMDGLHPDDREVVRRAWDGARAAGREFRMDFRFVRQRGVVWVSGSAVALRHEGAEVTGYLGTVMDVTEAKAAEVALRRSLHEKEVLLKEIHHRVKNNVQVISSLLRLQAGRVSDPQVREVLLESHGRVRAIGLLHEKLYRAHDLARVDMDDYVRGLTTELLRTYGGAEGAVRVTTDVRGVSLGIDAAVPCGLIVNELVTNALKHAFPGGSGRVEVRMRRDGALVEIAVADDGVGLPAGFDLAQVATLGLHLVRSLSRQLQATVLLERAGGTRCTIGFRVAETAGE
jgi:PAS domain S-box-containing protein